MGKAGRFLEVLVMSLRPRLVGKWFVEMLERGSQNIDTFTLQLVDE